MKLFSEEKNSFLLVKLCCRACDQRATADPRDRPRPAARRRRPVPTDDFRCGAADCRLRLPRPDRPRQPSPSPFGPCSLSALAPPLQPATRDEQSRRRPQLGHGPDGRGGRGRGAEAEVAAAEGGRRRLQPRRQFLLPHQHRPSQRSASAQLAGGLPDGDACRPHGTFSRLAVEISVGT